MLILATIPIYNEELFLPLQIDYLRQQGVHIHVIDNESTDNSRAICESLGVTVTRLHTGGSFDLTAIQNERARVAACYEYDWHLYGDADEWNLFSGGIAASCRAADAAGANVIRTASYNVFYTGETRTSDPRKSFYYGSPRRVDVGGITRLHKKGSIIYFGDAFRGSDLKELQAGTSGVNLNFGGTKSKALRLETLSRRKVAWQTGLRGSFGSHLLEAEAQDFVWNRESLAFLPNTPHWSLAREVIGEPEMNECSTKP